MGNSIFRLFLMFFWCLLLAGCYSNRFDLEPAPAVTGGPSYSMLSQASTPSDRVWWEAFGDPKLDALIGEALGNNFNVIQAMSRLDQAATLVRQARAARLPLLGLEMNSEKEWIDGDEQEGITEAGGALDWEIDVFNRLGSAASARRSEQAARLADVEAVQLSLSVEVAVAYFDAIEQRRQLALLNQQIDIDRNLLALTELRHKGGLTASIDVLQQSSQLAETESLVPPAEAALRVSENRLDVLVGQAPDAVNRVDTGDDFVDIGDLPFLGVPSDLLLNRPDLRALRHELVAADAEISRAIAERLPRITLEGEYFYAEGQGFTGPTALVLGSLVQPLVDWGARKAEVERNQALYVDRLAVFSQAYLEAIEVVENTLYQERKQREFLDRLEHRRQILERTVEETQDRYTNGLTDFLPVLDAVQELRQIERTLVREKRALLDFRIRLHRALGGRIENS